MEKVEKRVKVRYASERSKLGKSILRTLTGRVFNFTIHISLEPGMNFVNELRIW
jgi:hypothetical protein